MLDHEPRQIWKEAAVVIEACAGMSPGQHLPFPRTKVGPGIHPGNYLIHFLYSPCGIPSMKIQTVDYKHPEADRLFATSLKETGFCILENHPLSIELIHSIYKEWRHFLESGKAWNYLYSTTAQDGYFPKEVSETAKGHTRKDLKHYFHLYFPWGRYPEEVSADARHYFDEVFDLGRILLKWIEDHMDREVKARLKQPLSHTASRENTLLRIMQYPPLSGEEQEGAIRAAAHEDINLITLLPIGSSPGLEVYSRHDRQWHTVNCRPDSLVINIGDMLQEMTAYTYISTRHRVINPSGEAARFDRMSMPVFIHPHNDTYLSEKYPTARAYLEERLRELGVK